MKNRILHISAFICLVLFFVACTKPSVPKEYGYFRIDLPPHTYQLMDIDQFPYHFEYAKMAQIKDVNYEKEKYWINVVYPQLNAYLHCSYKPVKKNLKQLTDDAQEFVYSHAMKASAIPETEYYNHDNRVYGMLYQMKGNTASPIQFYLTDSTKHFFRAALYFNNIPNQDSLAPVIDYLREDIMMMMETFRWK